MSRLSRSGSRHDDRRPSPTRPPSLFAVRSSDGAEFALSKDDFRNITTLDELRYNLLSPMLAIPPDCLILMNEEGSPLNRDEAVQHLALLASTPASSAILPPGGGGGGPAGSALGKGGNGTERRIYVFDRDHLDADPEKVADALSIEEEQVLTEPPLNPEDPLPSHLSLSLHNLGTLRALIASIHLQYSSLSLALSNLHRVNTGTQASFELFLESANPAMERYERLLEGWEGAMDAVGKVSVVAGLLVRGGQGGGHERDGSMGAGGGGSVVEKQRFLGDYVSRDKMLAVRDGCAKVLAELKLRTETLQSTLNEAIAGTEAVQADLELTSRDLGDLEICDQDAEHAHLQIEELVQAMEDMTDPNLLAQHFDHLSGLDAEHRDRIRWLVQRKNAMTRYLLQEMQKISTLQSDIATMPTDLGGLDHDMRTRTDNFKHLARLEDLIPAYVATVVEVVRRREYARLLQTQSTSLSSSFAPLSSTERTRRFSYRASYSGKLPWEVRGLSSSTDEHIPSMALEVAQNGQEGLPDLGRETLEDLKRRFEELEAELGDEVGEMNPIRRARGLLREMVGAVEEMSQDFEQISLNPPPPRPPSVDPARLAALEAQVRQLEESNEALSRELQTERSSREEEVAQLEARCSAAEGASHLLRTRNDALEKDKTALERTRRAALERADQAEEERDREIGRREQAERELGAVKAAEGELRRQWAALDSAHAQLQAELGTVNLELGRVRTLVDERDAELDAAQKAQRELVQAVAEKDKLLRDQRNEVEVERAVLEKEADELRKAVAAKEREVEQAQARVRTLEEVRDGLREQIARWERIAAEKEEDVGAAQREVEDARREKERSVVDVQKALVRMTALAREAVVAAGKLRDANVELTAALVSSPPSKVDPAASTAPDADKLTSPDLAADPSSSSSAPISAVPSLDYAAGDLDDLVRELSEFSSRTALKDAVREKVDGLSALVKKWVKEAKGYRERMHRAQSATNDKIAFRNFAKGDLALFLPTRNSTIPVWAAFNVSFPHHFLAPTGAVVDQIKTREWIVARITSLTEKVVDPKDPSTNPYLLDPGVKYFNLEVEPWSSKESSRSRRHSTADKLKSSSSEKKSSKEARASRASESAVPTRSSLGGADSAILVDRPASVSASTPNIRRSASEGGPLPPSASALSRSEYAIVEVEEENQGGESRTPSPPVPKSGNRYPSPPGTGPSGLARALARSTPSSPVERRSNPFAESTSTDPFSSSSSPAQESLPAHSPTPPATDYDPSHSTAGAAPAFLPSSSRKPHSAAGSTAGSSSSASPRYVRSSARPIGSGRSITPHNPAAELLSSSPASTAASSVNVISHPRSASSGSSILSSSIHRRFASSTHTGSSPPVPAGKAPPTSEAQLADSSATFAGTVPRPPSSSSSSVAIDRKTSKGWPSSLSLSPSTHTGSGSTSPRSPSALGATADKVSTSASSASIFDVLTGRRASTAAAGATGGSASSSSPPKRKKDKEREPSSLGAEGEMRKLLGQPPF
ncbi:hypothetical protein JCM8097_002595 [Rhodosporidiobolus ruineniae]